MNMIYADNIAAFPWNYMDTEIMAAINYCRQVRSARTGYAKQKAEQLEIKLSRYTKEALVA